MKGTLARTARGTLRWGGSGVRSGPETSVHPGPGDMRLLRPPWRPGGRKWSESGRRTATPPAARPVDTRPSVSDVVGDTGGGRRAGQLESKRLAREEGDLVLGTDAHAVLSHGLWVSGRDGPRA